jgi:hypothetical protein
MGMLAAMCRVAPGRVRLPRVCQSPVGTLPAYSDKEAKGGFKLLVGLVKFNQCRKYEFCFIVFAKNLLLQCRAVYIVFSLGK